MLSACSSTGELQSAVEEQSSAVNTAADESSPAQTTTAGNETDLSEPTRLMVGTMLLQGGDNAVDAAQAAALLNLWKAYRSLLNSQTAAEAEIAAVLEQIEDEMTAQQIAAIDGMLLSSENIQDLMQAAGIEFGMGFDPAAEFDREAMQATRQALQASGQVPQEGQVRGQGANRPEGLGIPTGGGPMGEIITEGMDPAQLATLQAERGTFNRGGGAQDSFMLDALIRYLEELISES